jgi:hypothetical protein
MNEPTKDFSRIPAGACVLAVGEFELGDNGENAKTAPVRLVARSGKPIQHWFWGNVVHDLAGMHLHKSRVAIDYVHDEKEIVGYLNKFDSSSGDLVTSGALVPFKDSDRATEIVHKMRAGVPYEASINFGGDGIKIEDVPEGMVAQVNGYQFAGPGIIVREWPLRGVAICPYGADANTESASLSGDKSKTYTATVAKAEPNTKESDMKAETPVEVAALAETPEAVEVKNEIEEQAPVDAVLAEAEKEAVDATTPEGEPETVTEMAQESKPLSREEFVAIVDEFGAEIAALTVRDGGDGAYAMRLAYLAAKKENESLRGRVAELESKNKSGGTPVPVTAAREVAPLFRVKK